MQESSAAHRLAAIIASCPKEHDRVVFVGRARGLFIDNAKYAFLHAHQHAPHLRSTFMTFDQAAAKALLAQGLPAFCFHDADGPARLSKAAIVVSDDFWWKTQSPASAFTHGAFLVQLWHGIPLKAIGFPEIESQVNMNPEKAQELTCGYSGYNAVLSTSSFFCEKAFSRAFRANEFWNLGYPRNDVLLRAPTKHDLINADTVLYRELVQVKKAGTRVVFYMPTFRDLGGNVFIDGALNMERLVAFAEQHNIVIVCKFHPYENIQAATSHPNLRFCDPQSDPYPALRLADLLITDYSSIYFDFLHTNKPILFFPYDLENYITRNRELLFDYDAATPGPKVRDMDSLQQAMLALLSGDDPFAKERRELKHLAFEHHDAKSGERLTQALTALSAEIALIAPGQSPNHVRLS